MRRIFLRRPALAATTLLWSAAAACLLFPSPRLSAQETEAQVRDAEMTPAAADPPAGEEGPQPAPEREGRRTFERGDVNREDFRSRSDEAPTVADDAPASPAADANAADDADAAPAPEMVTVSFRDADLQSIAMFLMRQLNKPVIVNDAIAQTRLTILSPDQLPVADAFQLIGNALRQKNVIIVEGLKQIELLPIDQARRIARPVVGPEGSVADVTDQSRIVDRVFAVEHYDVLKLKDMVLPMLPDYAFLVADPNLNRLVVTAAAADLRHIEELIRRIDVPKANDTVQRIFTIEHGDASEIVNLVRTILAGTLGVNSGDVFTSPINGGSNPPASNQRNDHGNNNQRSRGGQNNSGPGSPAGGTGVGTLFVQRSEAPILLYADLSRNWIIAAASPAVMEQIEKWITELDVAKERSEPYELIDIEHADVAELSLQINEAVRAMPDADIQSSVRVIAFPKSKQLLVYGSPRGRTLVQSLLNQLDVESTETLVIKEITLQYDSAEGVKTKIEELFGRNQTPQSSGRGRPVPGPNAADNLTVTADPVRNTVTIMTDSERLAGIETIIREQWDTPLDLDDALPKVYELQYTEPEQVVTLLEDMFTRSSTTTTFNWRAGSMNSSTSQPVGRLFGQFSFVAMENSNKLIVSTKNSANYAVIDELLEQIDQPQDAGVPIIIELKHANAEDVAEQLNAMFAEAGTPAAITRNERGLSDAIRKSSTTTSRGEVQTNNNNRQNTQNGNQPQINADEMSFWWSQSRPTTTEQPASNLIGKPRIVPVNRRNAVMVLAPRAHTEPLRNLIAELDKPGSQVVIHAIITEIQHSNETTLGVRLASDPGLFSDSRLSDQSLGGGVNANVAEPIFRGDGILNANINLNFLIQLLIKDLDLKVLNEPRVYTSDNEEAHFFDGQDVPVVVSDFQGGNNNSGNITRSFDYEAVGTRLHVRPHITQEGEVNLEINLELSRIVNGSSVFGNFIFDRRETTTSVTVSDGQTIVISGIVQQEDFDEVRKLPLLGDLPLIGGLFRATDRARRNREIIAFVTPHIVSTSGQEAEDATERNREWLKRVRDAVDGPDTTDEQRRLISSPDERDMIRQDPAALDGPVAVPEGTEVPVETRVPVVPSE